MNYPLISEYVEAIRFAEDNFSTLTNLRAVLENGRPFMSSGNFAVVFKMKDVETGKLYAVKCFTREEKKRESNYKRITEELNKVDSPYLTSFQYYEKELFVDTNNCSENEFPVLLMDWVDGQTLDAYIRENLDDIHNLSLLYRNFCRMGAWLLKQPFAHGDLKHDNIMVKTGNRPMIVDYDGMYVPAMKGELASEIGSLDYRHPLRTKKDFNEHIDDFPLASIALSLKAISLDPSLLNRYGASDRLLFSEKDYKDLGRCEILQKITLNCTDPELLKLIKMLLSTYRQKPIPHDILMPEEPEEFEEFMQTEATKMDRAEAWKDEYGVLYSKDGKRLLKCENTGLTRYSILEETKVICDKAFSYCQDLSHIQLPNGLHSIGDEVFRSCYNLTSINLPERLISIGNMAFSMCKNLKSITIPPTLRKIWGNPFVDCNIQISSKSPHIKIENNLLIQGKSVICANKDAETVTVPTYITSIGDRAFENNEILSSIQLPDSLTSIRYKAFSNCKKLTSIELPANLALIGEMAFFSCKNLTSIKMQEGLLTINDRAFCCCESLTMAKLPEGLVSVGFEAFKHCKNLVSIEFPSSLISFGGQIRHEAFSNCENLKDVIVKCPSSYNESTVLEKFKSLLTLDSYEKISIIHQSDVTNEDLDKAVEDEYGVLYSSNGETLLKCPNKKIKKYVIKDEIKTICDKAFCNCKNLNSIEFPDSVTLIGKEAFLNCGISSLNLPNGLISIGDEAFYGCKNLCSLELPANLKSIGDKAFGQCENITTLKLPVGISSILSNTFDGCDKLEEIFILCSLNDDIICVANKFKNLLPSSLFEKATTLF